MSIAHQSAMRTPSANARRPSAPLHRVPTSRPGYAMVRILGLITITAVGAALLAGTVAIGIMMFASSMGA